MTAVGYDLFFSRQATLQEPAVVNSKVMNRFLLTGGVPQSRKVTVTEEVLNSTRLPGVTTQVGKFGDGSFISSLRYTQIQDPLEGLLGGTLATISQVGLTDIGVVVTPALSEGYTSTATDFTAIGFVEGMWIRVQGFANGGNNGMAKLGTVTANLAIVTQRMTEPDVANLTKGVISVGHGLTVEAAGPSVDISARSLTSGTNLLSYVLERRFPDAPLGTSPGGRHEVLPDWFWTQLAMSAASEQIVQMTWDGRSRLGAVHLADTIAISDNPDVQEGPLSSHFNVGSVLEDNLVLTECLESFDFTLSTPVARVQDITRVEDCDNRPGAFSLTGNMTVAFEDHRLRNKFLADARSSIVMPIYDVRLGNVMVLTFPRITFPTSELDKPGRDDAVTEALSWTGETFTYADGRQIIMQADFLPVF